MNPNGNSELHPIAKAITVLTAIVSIIFSLWCTVIAFVGGRLPIIGWELKGGLIIGLLWLFIIDPILITVCYWLSMIIAVPIAMLFSGKKR